MLTLSSPHQLSPVALQPSLGHFFSRVNQEWQNGYKTENKKFSNLVVISISGGMNDYQVRVKIDLSRWNCTSHARFHTRQHKNEKRVDLNGAPDYFMVQSTCRSGHKKIKNIM